MEAAALAAVSHPAAEDSHAAVSAAEAAEAGSDLSSGSWQKGVPLDADASYWENIEKNCIMSTL